MTNVGGQGKWKMLSLGLLISLVVSVILNVYSILPSPETKSHAPLEFEWTWSPGSQEIVNGTFRLAVKMWVEGDNVTIVATANDDDYNDWDYVGLVFDTNQNGYIDLSDESFMMFANNKTHESRLSENGLMTFPATRSEPGPQNVTFNSEVGYTFIVQFPFYSYLLQYDPAKAVKEGQNQLHVCFMDRDAVEGMKKAPGVFARFLFLAEGT